MEAYLSSSRGVFTSPWTDLVWFTMALLEGLREPGPLLPGRTSRPSLLFSAVGVAIHGASGAGTGVYQHFTQA